MMTKAPQISEAEWQVMQVLWEKAPLTASEVADTLCEPNQWHPKTVKTLLARLVRKGALRYREEGNRYIYRPAHAREKYVAEETKSFLDRVFGGDATPALVHFVEAAALSEADIQELRELLERKAKEEKR
jgi:BlaI family penicillinase repressor